MGKNPYDKILKRESKEQYLSTVLKSYAFVSISSTYNKIFLI